MKLNTALLTRADQDRLRRFISAHQARLTRQAEALSHLSSRVESARIVGPHEVPKDLVTMYSQVRMRDADTGRSYVITAALPVDHEIDEGGAFQRAFPIATVIGSQIGDDMVWPYAGGPRRATIEQVFFQPESRRVWSRAGYPSPARKQAGMSVSRESGARTQMEGRLSVAALPGIRSEPLDSGGLRT